MRVTRRSSDRGHVQAGWLDSRHTFSFGQYHDAAWMGWGPLRVLNEDRVAAGAGFPTHGHANMEILSYVLDGALAHRDDSGGEGVIHAGDWQWMSAGHGIEHSEFNASQDVPVHFLQIWIQPDRVNAPPAHALVSPDTGARRGRWAMLASPDGASGSLAIRQQAWLQGSVLGNGESVEIDLRPDRLYWLQVAKGNVDVGGGVLAAGDAMGFVDEASGLRITGQGGTDQRGGIADILLFDLPRQ